MFRRMLTATLCFVLVGSLCFGLGADHRMGSLSVHGGWPAGVHDVVNQTTRVHGYFINSSDTLYYRGKPDDFHKMLNALAANADCQSSVVIHAGKGIAKSPWSAEPISAADWSVTISAKAAIASVQDQIRIDIWLDGNLTLENLEIPDEMEVTSGGEIEEFLQQRAKP